MSHHESLEGLGSFSIARSGLVVFPLVQHCAVQGLLVCYLASDLVCIIVKDVLSALSHLIFHEVLSTGQSTVPLLKTGNYRVNGGVLNITAVSASYV